MSRQPFVIVNPASSGGATGKSLTRLRDQLSAGLGAHRLVTTDYPGHATAIAREAIHNGYEVIISVGGDGTASEVVNGFFEEGRLISGAATLGVVHAGTGGDFCRNLGLPATTEGQIERISAGQHRRISLGRADYLDREGRPASRYFVVICAFGFSSSVNKAVNERPRLKKSMGPVAFPLATVMKLFGYRKGDLSLELDGEAFSSGPILIGAACNGPFTGGGMQIAPDGDPFAPHLQVVSAGDLGICETLGILPRIYKGSHLGEDKVSSGFGMRLRATPRDGGVTYLDMDGDVCGTLPAIILSVPHILNVFC